MRIESIVVALAILAACASPWPREPVARAKPAPFAQNAAAPVALEREVRYYFDEEGMVWDDRGRKLDPSHGPQPPPSR